MQAKSLTQRHAEKDAILNLFEELFTRAVHGPGGLPQKSIEELKSDSARVIEAFEAVDEDDAPPANFLRLYSGYLKHYQNFSADHPGSPIPYYICDLLTSAHTAYKNGMDVLSQKRNEEEAAKYEPGGIYEGFDGD
jgi:hypothetical protein